MKRFRIARPSAPVGLVCCLILLTCIAPVMANANERIKSTDDQESTSPISYSRQVLPILQANCQGCHQPAKRGGEYLMTDFQSLLKGGESQEVAVVPGDPQASYLMQLITPHEGVAEMPQDRDPLSQDQVNLISQWIQQGAVDDSPPRRVFDQDHPPVYDRSPVVTTLATQPGSELLAVNGIHEVLLIDPSQGQVRKRLIGRSPRIESARFSPDGKRLAVAGGSPGEFGELQIWDLENDQLLHSLAFTGDVLFGCSWSPDGSKVAFGATDNTVRAVDADSGQLVLFQNVAEDWIRDTVFSVDGTHLISVGRDMTCKLTEVETERFVDNITSITPGVLKGGISSIARHPLRDEILIGTADGVPKVYRVFRETKRVIGDDANLLRRFPTQTGRVQSVAFSADGKTLAAVSGIDGTSELRVYGYDFDTQVPDDIKAINAKVVTGRSAEENQRLEDYVTSEIHLVQEFRLPNQSLYAVALLDGQVIAAGDQGQLLRWDLSSGQALDTWAPHPLQSTSRDQKSHKLAILPEVPADFPANAALLEQASLKPDSLTVYPQRIQVHSDADYVQLVAQAHCADGTQVDVTGLCQFQLDDPIVSITPDHLIQAPVQSGQTILRVTLGDQQVQVPVEIQMGTGTTVDFRQDVNPILGKLGCNAGTCHGSQDGKRGFKLSLRGYDPLFDIRALTDDLSARRVNIAAADDSLMLLKATATVAHEGGQLLERDSKYYQIIRQWIEDGAKLSESPRVTSLEIQPKLPVLRDAQQGQRFRVIATYDDGSSRDVTREAFIETANQEVAQVDALGRVTAKRRGEAPILARYEGAFAATTVTIMGQRDGFAWQPQPSHNRIDELVAQKWERMKILPSELCDDYEFLRRVSLDLTGLPPTADQVRDFVNDSRSTIEKRNEMIDQLIGSSAFVDHWTNKWADLLQVNEKFLGAEGARKYHHWIREQVDQNVPYDQFVRSILTASGSNAENPAASYYKILRTPDEVMENTTHLFLATRFNCNKCHDHPFERWTQDQYYATAAYFSQIDRTADPESGDRRIGGTAVEGAKPLFEVISDADNGQMIHQRTQQIAEPQFPFDTDIAIESDSRREAFAEWLTRSDNPYFASSYANRLWGYLLGVGLIEPIDDIRASNPPSHPQLLKYLTDEFVESDFDTRHVIRLICRSRVYQLSAKSNRWNQDDSRNYSHALPRRLPAEVLFDTLHQVTGSPSRIPGHPEGTRAAQLPDAGARLPSGLLATLGQPVRESACECERSNDLHLGSVLALVSGPDQASAIADPRNDLPNLVQQFSDDQQLVRELFLRILNRPANDDEVAIALGTFDQIQVDHQQLLTQLAQRQQEVAPQYQQAEQQREQQLAATEQELTKFIQSNDPDLLEREKAHQQQIASLEEQIRQFDSDLDHHLEDWRQQHLSQLQWHPLLPTSATQSSGAEIQVLSDRSLRSQNQGKTVTTVTVQTDLARVSAVRIEALAADDLPSRGPGLAENGNFVVNELRFQMETPDAPGEWKPVSLIDPQVDFSQQGFPIATLFDGNENQQGWAIHPDTGRTHWATFQLATPIAPAPGTRFRFQLVQNYNDGKHQLGRFRLSFSPSLTPVGLSLPEELAVQLAQQPQDWSPEVQQQFRQIVKTGHPTRLRLERQLANARQPLTIAPEIVALREKVQQLKVPTPRDATLIRLENEVEHSQAQREKLRLTAAQDLTWALINSPSFLFNH